MSAVCSVSLRCVPFDFPSLKTRVLFLGLVCMLLVRVCSVLSVPWPVFIDTAQGRDRTCSNDLTGPADQSLFRCGCGSAGDSRQRF